MAYVLGISCFYHDSAAALLKDGVAVAAAQEERFTRKKHDPDFPVNAVKYTLSEAGITIDDVDLVVFHEKPLQKLERIMESFMATYPKNYPFFVSSLPGFLGEKFWMGEIIRKKTGYKKKVIYSEHHISHAASSFYCSPFSSCGVLTVDGVGEFDTSTLGHGKGEHFELLKEIRFPHSLGLLYSAFTSYLGFKVNSAEYKVMGLAPYGKPVYADLIFDKLISVKDDGSFRLNMEYFAFLEEKRLINRKFCNLFGAEPRAPESKLTQREFDIAQSVQKVTEDVVLKMCNHLHEMTGEKKLVMAGGVALNCVANGKIIKQTAFKEIYVQPAAGDAGCSLGGALMGYYGYLKHSRLKGGKPIVSMHSPYLGPEYSDEEIRKQLDAQHAVYHELGKEKLLKETAKRIADGKVIGWHQGRMEWGPRALGNRSILADARDPKMKDIVNLKIKFRESFRPFAPAVMYEKMGEYFDLEQESPYMLLVAQVQPGKRVIPSVTHVDGSARIQSVTREQNELFYDLIHEFYKLTKVPIIINTSFNVRGEPIVNTPTDSYTCFMRTNMDDLVAGNFMMHKREQPNWVEHEDWQKKFVPD
jgi:carbamoyltransferase